MQMGYHLFASILRLLECLLGVVQWLPVLPIGVNMLMFFNLSGTKPKDESSDKTRVPGAHNETRPTAGTRFFVGFC